MIWWTIKLQSKSSISSTRAVMWSKSRERKGYEGKKCSDSRFDWRCTQRAALRIHTYVSIYTRPYTQKPHTTTLSRHLSLLFLSFSLHSCSSLHVLALFSPHFTWDLWPRPLRNLLEIDSCFVYAPAPIGGFRFLSCISQSNLQRED